METKGFVSLLLVVHPEGQSVQECHAEADAEVMEDAY